MINYFELSNYINFSTELIKFASINKRDLKIGDYEGSIEV